MYTVADECLGLPSNIFIQDFLITKNANNLVIANYNIICWLTIVC